MFINVNFSAIFINVKYFKTFLGHSLLKRLKFASIEIIVIGQYL